MESKITLNAKTRDIIVTSSSDGTVDVNNEQANRVVQLTTPKNNVSEVTTLTNGTLSILGSTAGYIAGVIESHNQDPHAHKKLWHVHEQGISSDVWEIQHNLDRNPSVTVVDTADNVVIGYVTYLDKNNVKITFNGAFKGKAYLN